MRNRVMNRHVLKAISIGLATFLASSTPLTVLAEEGTEHAGADESGGTSSSDDSSSSSSSSSSDNSGSDTHSHSSVSDASAGERDDKVTNKSSESQNENAGKAEKAAADAAEKAACAEHDKNQSYSAAKDAGEAKDAAENAAAAAETAKETAEAAADAAGALGSASDSVKEGIEDTGTKDAVGKELGEAEKAVEDADKAINGEDGRSGLDRERTDAAQTIENATDDAVTITAKDENGNDTETTVKISEINTANEMIEAAGNEIANSQKTAEDAAAQAKEALEEVLLAEQGSDKDNQEAARAAAKVTAEASEKAAKAAADASVQAKNAQDAADQVQAIYDAAKEEYDQAKAAYEQSLAESGSDLDGDGSLEAVADEKIGQALAQAERELAEADAAIRAANDVLVAAQEAYLATMATATGTARDNLDAAKAAAEQKARAELGEEASEEAIAVAVAADQDVIDAQNKYELAVVAEDTAKAYVEAQTQKKADTTEGSEEDSTEYNGAAQKLADKAAAEGAKAAAAAAEAAQAAESAGKYANGAAEDADNVKDILANFTSGKDYQTLVDENDEAQAAKDRVESAINGNEMSEEDLADTNVRKIVELNQEIQTADGIIAGHQNTIAADRTAIENAENEIIKIRQSEEYRNAQKTIEAGQVKNDGLFGGSIGDSTTEYEDWKKERDEAAVIAGMTTSVVKDSYKEWSWSEWRLVDVYIYYTQEEIDAACQKRDMLQGKIDAYDRADAYLKEQNSILDQQGQIKSAKQDEIDRLNTEIVIQNMNILNNRQEIADIRTAVTDRAASAEAAVKEVSDYVYLNDAFDIENTTKEEQEQFKSLIADLEASAARYEEADRDTVHYIDVTDKSWKDIISGVFTGKTWRDLNSELKIEKKYHDEKWYKTNGTCFVWKNDKNNTDYLVAVVNNRLILTKLDEIEAYTYSATFDATAAEAAAENAVSDAAAAAMAQGRAATAADAAATAAQKEQEALAKYQAALETLREAQERYDRALVGKEGLETKNTTTNVDYYEMKLAEAKTILDTAGTKLEQAKAANNAAQKNYKALQAAADAAANYNKWAQELAGDHSIMTFAQGNGKDKVTPLLYDQLGIDNEKGFDLSDILVHSQSTKEFTQNITTVTVPYDVFQSYLRSFYEKNTRFREKEDQTGIWNVGQSLYGKGISIGSVANSENVGTMEKTYFIYEAPSEEGKLGKLVSEAMTEQQLMDYLATISPDQTVQVFAGYVFKQESDGYHMDGIVVNLQGTYSTPAPAPISDPDPAPEQKSEDDGHSSSGTGGSGSSSSHRTAASQQVTVILDEDTPLAASLDGLSLGDGIVLQIAMDPGVIIDDEDVALADSIPQTGDTAVSVIPAAAAGIAALLTAGFMGKRKKEDGCVD